MLSKLYSATNHLVSQSLHKHSLRAASSLSFKSGQNPQFSRQIHSALPLRCFQASADAIDSSAGWTADTDSYKSPPPSSDTGNVEAFFDPMSGHVRTRAVRTRSNEDGNSEDNENSGGGLSSLEVGGPRVYGEIIGVGRGKKKGKSKTVWVCSDCGSSSGQWWGSCTMCKKVGTMTQFNVGESERNNGGGKANGIKVSENLVRTWLGQNSADAGPVRLVHVNRAINPSDWRIPLYVTVMFCAQFSVVFS